MNELVYHPAPAVLVALLDNPALDETKLTLLLSRKDLPLEVLEEIGVRKALLKNYAVKKAFLFHPRTPRLLGLRLLKDLYLMDLVQFALSPAAPAELKRYAEEQLVARLPQLPLGQKITLARRGPARVAGAVVLEGHAQVMPIALDNPYLTEAQVLKALAREKVPTVVVQALAFAGARHLRAEASEHREPAGPAEARSLVRRPRRADMAYPARWAPSRSCPGCR